MKNGFVAAIFLTLFLVQITYASKLSDNLISIEDGEVLLLTEDYEFIILNEVYKLKKGEYVARAGNFSGAIFVGPEKCLLVTPNDGTEKRVENCGVHRSTNGKKWRLAAVDVVVDHSKISKPLGQGLLPYLIADLISEHHPDTYTPYLVRYKVISGLGEAFGVADPDKLKQTTKTIASLMNLEFARQNLLENDVTQQKGR